jgi:hypothetical protein
MSEDARAISDRIENHLVANVTIVLRGSAVALVRTAQPFRTVRKRKLERREVRTICDHFQFLFYFESKVRQ